MAHHYSPAQHQAQLDTYTNRVNDALDLYKHAQISEREAVDAQREAAALLAESLRSTFLIRLRNLEAFRTSRGELVPPATSEVRRG